MTTKNISKFVLKFIESNRDANLTDNWNSDKNLKALKKILKKESKETKDINKPKRGKSSYLHFCDDYRKSVKKEFPNFNNQQLLSHLATMWKEYKESNPDIVNKYEIKSKKDRDRYTKEMLAYRESIEDIPVKEDNEDNEDNEDEHDDIPLKNLKKGKKDLIILETKKVEDEEEKEKKEKKKKKVEKVEKVEEKSSEKKNKYEISEEDTKGFERYVRKRKGNFIEDYPELDSDGILKKMQKKWSSFSDDKKQKYNKH